MLIGAINKRKKLTGFVTNGLIEPKSIETRHTTLAEEMKLRGMNHKSHIPIFDISPYHKEIQESVVNRQSSYEELTKRCTECKKILEAPEWRSD
jgi:tRNA (Thr-GGU) A37 N-methylase